MLGEGAYAKVFKACGTSLYKPVAIKVLAKETAFKSQSMKEQILDEINIHRALSGQPSILPLKEIYEDAEHLYIVTEFMQSGSLLDFLKSSRRRLATQ